MKDGYIKLHRKMMDWQWADDSTVFYFFVKLLFMVNYKDKQWHDLTIKRGQIITSIDKLCDYMNLSKTAIRRCLTSLIKTGEITQEVKPNKYRIITITNFEIYQSSVGSSNTNKRTNKSTNRSTKQSTNKSTNSSTPTKERKKYSPPLREENTAHAPERSDSAGLGAKRKTGEVVSWEEFIRFARSVPGASDYTASDFHSGFVKSHTYFPDDWQDIFRRLTAAPEEVRWKFLDDLKAGAYREKWGCVD